MRRTGLLFIVLLSILVVGAPLAQARPTVIIDAGHGGHDRGGVPGQKYSEKTYALDVAKRVQGRLKSAGFKTVMTRSGDYFVGLRERCNIANRNRNSVFVSVHFNSAKREGANGIETYYYGSRSAKLAAAVHKRMVRAAGTEDRRVRRRGFFVLRNTKYTAILAECGFLTNMREGRTISTSTNHRQKLADAIADGVIALYK